MMARPTMPPWPPEVTNAVQTLYSDLGCGFRALAADFELLGEGDEEVPVDEGPAPTPVPEFEPAGVLVEKSDAEGLEVEADVDETESVTEIEVDEQTRSDKESLRDEKEREAGSEFATIPKSTPGAEEVEVGFGFFELPGINEE
jgi:hypothetical protein